MFRVEEIGDLENECYKPPSSKHVKTPNTPISYRTFFITYSLIEDVILNFACSVLVF